MCKIACTAIAICIFMAINSHAQDGKDDLKINLSSIALKNYSFQFERGLTKHISVALGFRFEPMGSIPFQSTVQKIVKNASFDFSALQVGNTAITPEVRFYMGKGRQRGFYVAPYARFSNFNLDLPVVYPSGSGNGNAKAVFSGKVNGVSGGLMFGVQHVIAKVIVLDIWIIGAAYGSSSGNATYMPSQPLSPQDQQSLQQTLNNVNIKPFTFTSTVSANVSTMQTNGPWAGIRGAGINLGVRF